MNLYEALELLSRRFPNYSVSSSDFTFNSNFTVSDSYKYATGIRKSTNQEVLFEQNINTQRSPNESSSFLFELQCYILCNSPYIVKLIGFTNIFPFSLITEKTINPLSFYICKEKYLKPTQLSIIVIGVALGIEFLHKKKLIHRNLNPNHVLLDESFFPKISGLKNAKIMDDINNNLVSNDEMINSEFEIPCYIAPEMYGAKHYDEKIDIYSFGMLLYEICEKKRPFIENTSIKDLYLKVSVKNERPKFSDTSSTLRKLISKCWETDPNERYTASEVVEYLKKNKKSLFHKSKVEYINQYLKTTEQQSKELEMKSNFSVSNFISIKTAKDNQIKTEGRQHRSVTLLIHKHNPKNVINENNSIVKKKRKSMDFIKNQNSVYDPVYQLSKEKSIASILSDCDNPYFSQCLQFCENNISISEAKFIVEPLLHHFQKCENEILLESIMNSIIRMIQRDIGFLKVFTKDSFFAYLPSRGQLIDKTIMILQYLFYLIPEAVTNDYFNLINSLLFNEPKTMIKLINFYVYYSTKILNPWSFFDILIKCAPYFKDLPQGAEIIHSFSFLIGNHPKYASARLVHVNPIFAQYLYSKCKENVIMTYKHLLQENIVLPNIDMKKIIHHLKKENFWNYAILLLLKIEKLTPSKHLYKRLLKVLKNPQPEAKNAWLVLYRIADDYESDLFLTDFEWFEYVYKDIENGYTLFMILYRAIKNRELLSCLPQYINMIKVILRSGDPWLIDTIPSIMTRGFVNQERLNQFTKKGLLKDIISVMTQTDAKGYFLQYKCMVLFDHFTRHGYSPDFLLFVEPLIYILQDQNFAEFAISVITSMSSHHECAISFKNYGLVPYFEQLLKIPKYKKNAKIFLSNVFGKNSSK